MYKKSEKGVSKVVKKSMSQDDFVNVYKQCIVLRKDMIWMSSFKHQIYIMESNKITLTSYDDKRYYLDDGNNSLAYGH